MANKKISELTLATSITGAELIPIVQAGETKRIDLQSIADLATVYTDEQAQDAIGNILVSTLEIGASYNDSLNTISFDLQNESINYAKLGASVRASLDKADNAVLLSGNQTIDGQKSFIDDVNINYSVTPKFLKVNDTVNNLSAYINGQGSSILNIVSLAGSVIGYDTTDDKAYIGLSTNGFTDIKIKTDISGGSSEEPVSYDIIVPNITENKTLAFTSDISGIATNAAAIITKQNILTEGAFVDGDKTKLDGIEIGATADQVASEVALTDGGGYFLGSEIETAMQEVGAKLLTIATGAEVNPDVVSQVEAEAGVATTERIWTAQRVKQAIDALGGGGSALVDDNVYDGTWSGDLNGISKNRLYEKIESVIAGVGTGATPETFTAVGGETQWIVTTAITSSHKFFVNGVKLVEGTDYTQTGSTFTFTGYTSVAGHKWEYFPDIAVPTSGGGDALTTDPLSQFAATTKAQLNAVISDGTPLYVGDVTGVTTELKPTDIDTLAELNAILTDATLIDTNDARLSDARTPTAHTHTASEVTDFDTEVSNNASVVANTAKVTYPSADSTKVGFISVTQAVDLDTMESNIATNNTKVGVTTEEANTIDSVTAGEPTGSDQVLNVVSLTQAEYDAGTPIATTFYIITG